VLHRSLRLHDVLQSLCDIAANMLGADKAVVWNWDETHQRPVVSAGHGISQLFRARVPAEDEASSLVEAFDGGEVVTVEDTATDPRVVASARERDLQEGVRAWIGARIRTADQVFGNIAAGYAEPRGFAERERRVMLALAQRAALAIQNARLYQRSQQAATLEERQRLARELHDSVTQALYAISIYTDTAGRALADRATESAATNLADAREATQEALQEMRLLIYELRPPLLEEFGLAAALRARLKAVETRAGLETRFESDGEGRMMPETEQELYRVAQEALNNVLKHAHAQRVTVRLAVGSEWTTMEIADDGVGFDLTISGPNGLGLPGMRERVERLRGTLNIKSAPGAGTCLHVEVSR
jgi:signal transduction histidine kinase